MAVDNQIALELRKPPLINANLVRHVVDVKVKNVEHFNSNSGDGRPNVGSAASDVPRALVSLNSLEHYLAEASVLNQCDFLSGGMVHDIILVFDGVPVQTDTLRFHLADEALPLLRVLVVDDLVVQSDHMLFLLAKL